MSAEHGHEHHSDFVPRRFVVAEFGSAEALLDGTTKMREGGYAQLDTHTPYPIHGLEEALGLKRPKIPLIVLCGAIAGACIAYGLIYFCNVYDWPLNIGNRPPHGPPANIPITRCSSRRTSTARRSTRSSCRSRSMPRRMWTARSPTSAPLARCLARS